MAKAKQVGLSAEQREEINAALSAYGAHLTEGDRVEKGGRVMSVRLGVKGGRLRVEGGETLLASYPTSRIGNGISDFVEKFWFWKKQERVDPAGGSFIAYPRSGLESFPPIYSPTVAGAVSAGLAIGLPFDVHTPGGCGGLGMGAALRRGCGERCQVEGPDQARSRRDRRGPSPESTVGSTVGSGV